MRKSMVLTAVVVALGFLAVKANGETGSNAAYQKAMDVMMESMTMSYSGDPDIDFVKSMIPHHQGAIDMATVELEFGKDPEAVKLAGDIIKAQESEIALMNEWLAKNAAPASELNPAATKAFEAAMSTMMKDMMMPRTGDADADFMKGMMPHHQGAIDMAKVVLEHGKDPEIKALAQSIITAQEREIGFMEDWLGKKGE